MTCMTYPSRPSFLDTCEEVSKKSRIRKRSPLLAHWSWGNIHAILRVEVVRSEDSSDLHTQGWCDPHPEACEIVARV